jgi:shikimate kinase
MKSSATTKAIWSKSETSNRLRRDPEENIALTGFMAVGKSAVGRKLARRLGRRFVDLDKLIERSEGMKVGEIFSRKGERYFRKVESDALAATLGQKGQVIATGGGVVMDKDNLRLLHQKSYVICLTASADVIQRRIGSGMQRPLLSGPDVAKRIQELLEQRAANYSEARACIDTTALTVEQVVNKIVALVAPENSG